MWCAGSPAKTCAVFCFANLGVDELGCVLVVQMAVLDYTPHVGIWHLPMFFVLFIVQKIVQLAWYHHIIKTARSLLEGLLEDARRRSS